MNSSFNQPVKCSQLHWRVCYSVHCSYFVVPRVILLQLVVSLVPTSAKYHSIDIYFEVFVYTSPVMDPFIHNLSCDMICKGNLFYWYSEVTILHIWAFLTFGPSLLVTFNYYQKKKRFPTLPAKTLYSIPSMHL